MWKLTDQFCISTRNMSGEISTEVKAYPIRPTGIRACEDDISHENEDSEQLAATRWKEMKDLINKLHISPDLQAVKELAYLAYGIRRSVAFRNLISTQCQHRQRSKQILERIGKVSKFYRSALSLIRVATCATLRHKHIKVETIPSVSRKICILRDHSVKDMRMRLPAMAARTSLQTAEIQRLLRRWQKYVVHAEILLLIFYEEHPQIVLATRYIGISKRSCYLCANFIRLHNFFTVEGQHQQLYCLWTLPEEIIFESEGRAAKFTRSLSDLQILLTQRMIEATMPQHRPLAFFKESVANFSRATILARAQSLENLDMIMESKECLSLNTSIVPLDLAARNSDLRLERQETENLKTEQDSVTKQAKANRSSTSSSELVRSSIPDEEAVEHPPNQFARSPEFGCPTSNNSDGELPHARRRHHGYQRTRHREQRRRRRKSKQSPARHQTTTQTRKKRTKHSPRKGIAQVSSRVLATTRRDSKKNAPRKRKNSSVGCFAVLVAHLSSAGRAALNSFMGKQ